MTLTPHTYQTFGYTARLVAQVGNLLCRRLVVGGSFSCWGRLRIGNPRHSRLPVCATSPLRASRKSGFTLMELMVVLVLIGIMTAMILPEMKGTYEEALLSSTGRELANVLGVAYSRAVTVHQPHRVRLDKITHRYSIERRVHGSHGQSSFAPVRDLPGGEGTMDVRISIELRKPGEDFSDASDADSLLASKGGMSFRDGDEAIVFYPDGTADAREIQLEDRDGFRLVLRINPTTARVQIMELERK